MKAPWLSRRQWRARGKAFMVIGLGAAALFSASCASRQPARSPDYAKLERRLERLRIKWKIPGMAAGVAEGSQMVWTKEFGMADLEAGQPVTPETVFHLASLTKPFAAVLALQLAESRKLDLDEPVASYGVNLDAEGVLKVRHLLNHTSEGVPGGIFRYNGNRFAELDKVLAKAGGSSFARQLRSGILDPLKLNHPSP